MKRAAPTGNRGQPWPQEAAPKIWRVFEYRRPVPARRIRFTT